MEEDASAPVSTPTRHDPEPTETVIERRRGWQSLQLRELWSYRDLMFFLAWRDVKIRYQQTVLGIAWAVLQPVLMMTVFTILFSQLAGVDTKPIPYPLFVYIGLLPWTFFATSLSTSSSSIVESERLITKVYFPRLLIPFGAVGAALVDFAVGGVVLASLLAFYGIYPVWSWLVLPLILVPLVLTALGTGTFLSSLNVQYRDFRYVIPFLVQIWMFATPSIFLNTETTALNRSTVTILGLNPLTGLIANFRAGILGTGIVWHEVGWGIGLSLGLFVVGCFVFRRMEGSFSDVI